MFSGVCYSRDVRDILGVGFFFVIRRVGSSVVLYFSSQGQKSSAIEAYAISLIDLRSGLNTLMISSCHGGFSPHHNAV